MGHEKWMVNPTFSRRDREKDSEAVAARWLSVQCPTYAENKDGNGPMIRWMAISLLLSLYARA